MEEQNWHKKEITIEFAAIQPPHLIAIEFKKLS